MNKTNDTQRDYSLIEEAIGYISQQAEQQPTLGEIANHVGLSEHHFQKVFSRWAGISPKRFLQYLTKEHIKHVLKYASVESAAFEAGLSTKSRAHDLMVSCEAISPGEYKQQGKDLAITYGIHPTPFGLCLIATTPRGICKLSFCDQADGHQEIEELHQEWPYSSINRNDSATAGYVESLFALSTKQKPLHLLLKGTNFQLKVWEALLAIEPGELGTYQDIANRINSPKGIRAVGSAIGKNPVAFLIPCHRVIRKTGELNQYRWGTLRKQALIGWEQACKENAQA